MKQFFISVLLALLGAGLFLFCLYLTNFPPDDLFHDIDQTWVLISFVAQLGTWFLMTWRWLLIAKGGGSFLPFGSACRITSYSTLAAAVLPLTLTDLVGRAPWAARQSGCGLLNATNAVLCDRLLDIYLLGLLLFPSLLFCSGKISFDICLLLSLGSLCLGFIFLCILGKNFFIVCNCVLIAVRLLCDSLPFLQGKFRREIANIDFTRKQLIFIFIISILKYCFATLATLAYFHIANISISFITIFLLLPLTQIAIVIAFTPGGIGIFEFGWLGILTIFGMESEKIGTFLIAQRVYSTLVVLLCAIVAFLFIRESLVSYVINFFSNGRGKN